MENDLSVEPMKKKKKRNGLINSIFVMESYLML